MPERLTGGWIGASTFPTFTSSKRQKNTCGLSGPREENGAAGSSTSDAHLAALALFHGLTLVSFDNDFARFPRLQWINPLTDKGLPQDP